MGDPVEPSTDIDPVINEDTRATLERHLARLEREGKALRRLDPKAWAKRGCFFGRIIAEIPKADFSERKVFGPILHVHCYRPDEFDAIAAGLDARGRGLRLGNHSRIKRFADEVHARAPAGNVYVNLSIIGAVVAVQPFGGEGLWVPAPRPATRTR